jgi:hypothetical protein
MDNDFPMVMSGNDFLTSYIKKYGGGEQYSQTGTDIPTFSVGRDFAGGEGTGIPPYFNEEVTASPGFGGQYRNLGEIAGSPSFDLDPDFDSPIIDRDLERYREQHGRYKPDSQKILQNIERLRNSLIRGV